MRKYVAILITIMAGILVANTAYSVRSTKHQKPERLPINLIVDQLSSEDGLPPVEILQPSFSASQPNRIEESSYTIKNNTTKSITALVVNKTISYAINGTTIKHSGYSSVDYALHPDVGAHRVLAPSNELQMDSSPVEFEPDAVIKEINLRLDYILFDDNTSLGRGGGGEKKINLMREGARKFKGLLVQRYRNNGESLSNILPLLESRDAYPVLQLTDINLTLGADRYRLHLLKTLQTKGAREVERFLK